MRSMWVVFRRHNNKGQLSARPWVVINVRGAYVSSFETEAAANSYIEGHGRVAA